MFIAYRAEIINLTVLTNLIDEQLIPAISYALK